MNKLMLSFFLFCLVFAGLSPVQAVVMSTQSGFDKNLDQGRTKAAALEALISEADQCGIDTSYEKTTLGIAKFFFKCIEWDTAHISENVHRLKAWKDIDQYVPSLLHEAKEMPVRELMRTDEVLSAAIRDLQENINNPKRRPGVWKRNIRNAAFSNDYLYVAGEPVFYGGYNLQLNHDDLTNLRQAGSDLADWGPRVTDLFPDGELADEAFIQKEMDHLDGINSMGMLYEVGLKWPGIPQWVLEKYPDIDKSHGHFFPVDIDHSGTMELLRNYAESYVSRLDPSGALMYLLVNEIQFDVFDAAQSSYFRNNFRKWAEAWYGGDIGRLNDAWDASYQSFSEIAFDAELWERPASWYDVCKFNQERVTAFVKKYRDLIKEKDPQAITYVKVINEQTFAGTTLSGKQNKTSLHRSGVDREALAEILDINGCDTRILPGFPFQISTPWYDKDLYSLQWISLGISYDFMKSIAPDKPLHEGEWHVMQTVAYRNPNIPGDHIRTSLWLSQVLGMSGNMIWGWTRGGPSALAPQLRPTRSVYAGLANQPQLVNAYAQGMIEVNAYADEIISFARAPRPIRILYSEASAIQDMSYLDKQLAAYEALFFFGEKIGFVTERMLLKEGMPADCKWLIIPGNNHVNEATPPAIRDFINNGGKAAIVGNTALQMNEQGKKHPGSLIGFVKDLPCVSPTGGVHSVISGLEAVMPDGLKNRSVECGSGNGIAPDLFWRTVEFNGETLLLLMNVSSTVKNVEIRVRGNVLNRAYDLLENENRSLETLTLRPGEFRLLQLGK